MPKYITLTQGKKAIVDSSLFAELNQHKWWAVALGARKEFYAVRKHPRGRGRKPKRIWLHHEVRRLLGHSPSTFVDHKNCNTLDCRGKNLRPCTIEQNGRNRRISINNTSGRKGVSWFKSTKKWRTQIRINGTNKHLGYFTSLDDAHAAYCRAAKKYYGEFFNPG